ncbi:BadF/BadG/BcrA/BcrD ATPase family protein [Deinococcus daejeonensis]|uniref:BadF/BadG/BcrA/BcrD ATPase family protein n=1 Tax=Deinococcus daejeonensis TaxID=1007098 RepID=UPI001E5D39C7|nr:BadF/BadG/BcrA/BcrD ATPase family protein [Deinococcus daejeonensis]
MSVWSVDVCAGPWVPVSPARRGPVPVVRRAPGARVTPLVVGLDLGGSSSKWQVRRGAEVLGEGAGPPVTATLLTTEAGRVNLRALREALPAGIGAVWAGLPGFGGSRPDAAALHAQLAAGLGIEAGGLHLESDLDLAFRAHLRPGGGVLVYAGTGSVAYHVAAGGQVLRAGGHGFHIDDDGAGYALGRAALRWVTGQLDRGHVPGGALALEVRTVTGGLDWDALRQFTYAQPGAAAVARLAPAVGRAADAGDVVARAILRDAAQALAALAVTVQRRLPEAVPVVATGGALRVSPLFGAEVRCVCPDVVIQQRDHAAVAALAAAQLGPDAGRGAAVPPGFTPGS